MNHLPSFNLAVENTDAGLSFYINSTTPYSHPHLRFFSTEELCQYSPLGIASILWCLRCLFPDRLWSEILDPSPARGETSHTAAAPHAARD